MEELVHSHCTFNHPQRRCVSIFHNQEQAESIRSNFGELGDFDSQAFLSKDPECNQHDQNMWVVETFAGNPIEPITSKSNKETSLLAEKMVEESKKAKRPSKFAKQKHIQARRATHAGISNLSEPNRVNTIESGCQSPNFFDPRDGPPENAIFVCPTALLVCRKSNCVYLCDKLNTAEKKTRENVKSTINDIDSLNSCKTSASTINGAIHKQRMFRLCSLETIRDPLTSRLLATNVYTQFQNINLAISKSITERVNVIVNKKASQSLYPLIPLRDANFVRIESMKKVQNSIQSPLNVLAMFLDITSSKCPKSRIAFIFGNHLVALIGMKNFLSSCNDLNSQIHENEGVSMCLQITPFCIYGIVTESNLTNIVKGTAENSAYSQVIKLWVAGRLQSTGEVVIIQVLFNLNRVCDHTRDNCSLIVHKSELAFTFSSRSKIIDMSCNKDGSVLFVCNSDKVITAFDTSCWNFFEIQYELDQIQSIVSMAYYAPQFGFPMLIFCDFVSNCIFALRPHLPAPQENETPPVSNHEFNSWKSVTKFIIAGSFMLPGYQDGQNTSALFSSPTCVDVDQETGDIFVVRL